MLAWTLRVVRTAPWADGRVEHPGESSPLGTGRDTPMETQETAPSLSLEVAARTNIGYVRKQNEDNYYVADEDPSTHRGRGRLFAVADGMGGHRGGKRASQIAVDTAASYYEMTDGGQGLGDMLRCSVEAANRAIWAESTTNDQYAGMGTTLTTLVIHGNQAYLAHVGDSRIYRFRGSRLQQITEDHSLVAEAVRQGLLTEDQARHHPQRNIITKALGTNAEVEVDVSTLPIQEGDLFLLASDGLHGMVEDPELERIVIAGEGDLEKLADDLVEAALDAGGHDNVTVVLVRCAAAP